MIRPGGAAIALLALALAGCLATPTHHCASEADCGTGETCLPVAPDDQRCARDSEFCDSGLAWTDDAGDLAGSCVEAGAPLGWNPCYPQAPVSDQTDTCAADVCSQDPRCCTREWSDTCVNLADRLCGLSCGGVAAFVGAGETWVGAWNGDEYAAFWSADVTGLAVRAVAFGDYDLDDRPDLATCDDGAVAGSAIRIYHNDGDGFSLAKELPTGLFCLDVDWVDFDGDGGLDVVATGAYEADWVRNDHGLWADPTVITDGFLVNTDWADVDGDGLLDAAVARYDSSMVVLRNQPAGFTTWYDSLDNQRYKSMSWGEVDQVGGLDLLVAGESFLRVVPNSQDGAFVPATPTLVAPAADTPAALFADVDEDGDLDVVALAYVTPLRVFRNDYDGGAGAGFTGTPLWESATQPFADPVDDGVMQLGDADGDRHLDLVACGAPDFCQMWLGGGDGTFTQRWDPGGARTIYGVALTSDWRP